eukprot:scaffold16534_cov82-Amphora_coffeaeformis.AAC.1
MEAPTLLLPSSVLVAMTKSFFKVMPGRNGCPRLPPMEAPTLLLPYTVLVAMADEIIFHGHAGMEWLPSVAPNGGSHTPIAIYRACGIGHAGMEWLPSVAPNGGSDTPIAIYSACGY